MVLKHDDSLSVLLRSREMMLRSFEIHNYYKNVRGSIGEHVKRYGFWANKEESKESLEVFFCFLISLVLVTLFLPQQTSSTLPLIGHYFYCTQGILTWVPLGKYGLLNIPYIPNPSSPNLVLPPELLFCSLKMYTDNNLEHVTLMVLV